MFKIGFYTKLWIIQCKFERSGEWRKKSIVREAILKFSENCENSDQKIIIERAPKTTAHKSETKPKETEVNQTQIQPNSCNPPMPKAPVKNNLHPLEPNDPLGKPNQ